MAKASKTVRRFELVVTVSGKEYKGTYWVDRGCVTVSAWGPDACSFEKSTQLGNSPAEWIAQMLLRELAQGGSLG